MCGVVGVVSPRASGHRERQIDDSLVTLAHRGPDDSGVAIFDIGDWTLGVGHTRLSIIDLSDAGHQPMASRDGRYQVVFNGEIYNYREIRKELIGFGESFATETDTEVLVVAWSRWGEEALFRFIGMFAFALVDTWENTLTLVRDGFGIKPLFWSLDKDEFTFASEIQGIDRVRERNLAPNDSVVTRYLMMGSYDTGPESFFDGVSRLEPGTVLVLDLNNEHLRPVIRRWWNPRVDSVGPQNLNDAADFIRDSFLESVRLHLRSDVSLGFALSGGIDSSAIVCAARHLEPEMPIRTFSFVSPGAADNEQAWIDIVNQSVGAESQTVVADSNALQADLLDLIRTQGEPFGDTSIYAQYLVFRLAKESGVTVTLDGQGADELFAGYSGYVERRLKSLTQEWKFREAVNLIGTWSTWPGRSKGLAVRDYVSLHLPDRWVRSIRSTLATEKGGMTLSWLREDAKDLYSRELPIRAGERGRSLVSMLRWEMTEGGLGSLLRHGDRNSMRWSIESRVPFLTIPLAEATLGLPEHFLLSREGETKHVLRRALRGLVPGEILDRRDKIGFQTPESEWVLGLGPGVIDTWLEGLRHLPSVNAEAAREGIWTQVEQGKVSSEMWRYVNAALWAETFFAR